MSLENTTKYYTPTIEEFHVGFEYEAMSKYTDSGMLNIQAEDPEEWYKFTFPDPYVGYMLPKLFRHCNLRVKYLSQEDIESLGFLDITRTKGNYDSSDIREKEVYLLLQEQPSIKEEDWRIRIVLRVISDTEIRIQRRYYGAVGQGSNPPYGIWRFTSKYEIFQGQIKNKSELKKLLKQLGINETTT